jgi:predicted DNA-binding protein
VGKVVVTFKLEEEIYSKLRNMAKNEGRGVSEIVREALTDWLRKKNSASASDFITFIKEQKNSGKTLAEISSFVLGGYGISLNKEQLKSLSRTE